MPSFSTQERTTLLNYLLELAQADDRVSGGALVGSYSDDKQDEWSDLDISFGIADGIDHAAVLNEWTLALQGDFEVAHHFDVRSGRAIYRVILFTNGLELDLSVVPESEFGPKAPSFKLLFGKALGAKEATTLPTETLFGWGWHHVLHANAAIHRQRYWFAEYWITSLRHHLIALKCESLGLPTAHSRGADQLPEKHQAALENTLIASLKQEHLKHSLKAISELLTDEIRLKDPELANRLSGVFEMAFNG